MQHGATLFGKCCTAPRGLHPSGETAKSDAIRVEHPEGCCAKAPRQPAGPGARLRGARPGRRPGAGMTPEGAGLKTRWGFVRFRGVFGGAVQHCGTLFRKCCTPPAGHPQTAPCPPCNVVEHFSGNVARRPEGRWDERPGGKVVDVEGRERLLQEK